MKLEKLTPTQQRVLRKLTRANKWCSAFELQESLATLDTLVRKKYAKKIMPLGSFAFPRNSIKYKAIVREA